MMHCTLNLQLRIHHETGQGADQFTRLRTDFPFIFDRLLPGCVIGTVDHRTPHLARLHDARFGKQLS